MFEYLFFRFFCHCHPLPALPIKLLPPAARQLFPAPFIMNSAAAAAMDASPADGVVNPRQPAQEEMEVTEQASTPPVHRPTAFPISVGPPIHDRPIDFSSSSLSQSQRDECSHL